MDHLRAWLSQVERVEQFCFALILLGTYTEIYPFDVPAEWVYFPHWLLTLACTGICPLPLQFFPSWGNSSSSLIGSAQVHRGKKALTFCIHLCVLIFALILAYQCHTILSDLSFLFIQPFLVFSRWTFSNHCNITKNETKAYVFTLFYCHIILLMQSQFLPAPAK